MKLFFAAVMLGGSCLASSHLEVALASEVDSITPGETFWIGLQVKPAPGFHVYWKHPGIVGLATSVVWSLPPGFKAGEMCWPAPEVVKMGSHSAQGYRKPALIMLPVTAPAELQRDNAKFAAIASWMCCGDQCLPENSREFELTLPIRSEAKPVARTNPDFTASRKDVPLRDEAWRIAIERGEGNYVLTLSSTDPILTRDVTELGSVRFFTADGRVDSNAEQRVNRNAAQQIRIELVATKDIAGSDSPTGTKLSGVVVAEKSWRKLGGPAALEIP